MPASRTTASSVSYNASADPRRRPPGSAPPPAAGGSSNAPVASTSRLPAPPAAGPTVKSTPYDRPVKPGMIRCGGACGEDLPPSQFSQQQHRNRRKPAVGEKAIMCLNCAPKQQETMKCADCDAVKPLASFALRQRSNPTSAVCSSCQSKINARNRQKRSKNDAYGSDIEDSSDSDAEEQRAKAVAAKGNPYEDAEEDDWDLYR